VLPSGQAFVSASGAPYRIDRFRLSDLAEDGFRYVTGAYPNAVAVTAGGGGLLAAGRSAAYEPDIEIFAVDYPSQRLFSHDFGLSRTLLDQGLAWSPDGRRLFAVDGQQEPSSVRLTAFDVAPG